MRWMWIDRFVEFVDGSHAKAVKTVSLSEEHIHDHFPGFPIMPQSLMLEGMAQTGGVLLGKVHQFKMMVVLAKVPRMTFHSWAIPGDAITYTAKLIDARTEGGMVEVQAHVGDRLVADGEIVYAHVSGKTNSGDGLDQNEQGFPLSLRTVLDIGKAGTGLATGT